MKSHLLPTNKELSLNLKKLYLLHAHMIFPPVERREEEPNGSAADQRT